MTWTLQDYANTREQALGIWLVVLVVGCLAWSQTRSSLLDILVSLGNWKVLTSLVTYAAFLTGAVWAASAIGLWTPKLLGATVVWFLVTGLAFYTNAVTKAKSTKGFFSGHIRETFRFAALFEFFVNVQTLPLWAELLLLPFLFCLVLLRAVAGTSDENRIVRNFLTIVLAAITVGLLTFTVVSFVLSPGSFVPLDAGRELVLPVFLALVAVPFAYLSALLAGYESMMVRLQRFTDRRGITLGVRLGLFSALRGNLREIDQFAGRNGQAAVRSGTFKGAREEVARYRRESALESSARDAARQRLIDFAGIEGVDERGRELDRREFEATKRALEWLAVCHRGHYRQRNAFNRNLLTVVADFKAQGLESPHGIAMKVRSDGKAWFAWRRTPSGHFFGIGAVGEPEHQWYYDGKHQPSGYPSEKGGWSSVLSPTRTEWGPENST